MRLVRGIAARRYVRGGAHARDARKTSGLNRRFSASDIGHSVVKVLKIRKAPPRPPQGSVRNSVVELDGGYTPWMDPWPQKRDAHMPTPLAVKQP